VVGAVDEDRVASGLAISFLASTSVRTGTATSAEVRTGRAPNRCRRWTTKRPADGIQETGPGPWITVQAMIGPEAVSMVV